MRRLLMVFALLLVSLTTGCVFIVRTLHPLYQKRDLVMEPALLGNWRSADSTETWSFTAAGDSSYRLVYVAERDTGEFVVHALRLGKRGELFLDLFPADLKVPNEYYGMHFVPAHTFLRVPRVGPALSLQMIHPDSVEHWLARHPRDVRHEQTEDEGIVLTAPPRELQRFALACLARRGFYGEPWELTRMPEH